MIVVLELVAGLEKVDAVCVDCSNAGGGGREKNLSQSRQDLHHHL